MKVNKILGSVEPYIPEVEILDLKEIINDFVNRLSLKIAYKDRHTDFLDALKGSQAQSYSTTKLVDTTANFPIDSILIGMTLNNITDGSSAIIRRNRPTEIETDALAGGTNNYWEVGDAYSITLTGSYTLDTQMDKMLTDSAAHFPYESINNIEQFLAGSIIVNTTDTSSAKIVDNTKTTIKHTPLYGGTDNYWELDDKYTITISGSCTRGGSTEKMIDKSRSFNVDEYLVGGTIKNMTLAESQTIIATKGNTVYHEPMASVWAARDLYEITPPTGTHTNSNTVNNLMTDENTRLPAGTELAGFTIANTTDGFTALVVSSTRTTITHAVPTDGGNNYWEKYDVWTVAIIGTHTDETVSTTILTDTDADFPLGECFIGDTIKNITDESSATITSITKTTITHGALTGGTNNYWSGADVYQIVSQRVPLPRDIVAIDTIFTTDSDSNEYESKQDISLKDIYEDFGYNNEHCAVEDRIIHFPEDMDEDSTMIVYVSRPYAEQSGIIENTAEVDIPDKYFPLIRAFCIKEICIFPKFKETYGYLYSKFDSDYERLLEDIATSKNSASYAIGDTY